MLWDMSWRLGTCGGFHPIHPLVHFAAHSSYTVELNSDYSWAGAFYVFPDPLQTLPGPPRARALHPLFLNKRKSFTTSFPFLPPPMMRTLLSFAVSTLAPSSYIRVLLQSQMSIFPLPATPNPICACSSVGPSLMWRRWTGGGGRCCES